MEMVGQVCMEINKPTLLGSPCAYLTFRAATFFKVPGEAVSASPKIKILFFILPFISIGSFVVNQVIAVCDWGQHKNGVGDFRNSPATHPVMRGKFCEQFGDIFSRFILLLPLV